VEIVAQVLDADDAPDGPVDSAFLIIALHHTGQLHDATVYGDLDGTPTGLLI
jgi:hypothetical protein